MSLTVLAAQGAINRKLGPYAALVHLPEELAWAARHPLIGLTPLDPMTVTDNDIAGLDNVNLFLDIAEWKASEAVLPNLTDEQLRQIGVLGSAEKVRPSWERRVKRLYEALRDQYGFGQMPLDIQVVNMNFASNSDDNNWM